MVVTRNDYGWGESLSSTKENYAVVVCLRDRENNQARLYSHVQTFFKFASVLVRAFEPEMRTAITRHSKGDKGQKET